jgi:hypothetical protein
MEKEWIPVISTLIGVLIGGGITSFAKYLELKHQRKQEHKKLILEKLENLHILVNHHIIEVAEYSKGVIQLEIESDKLSKYHQMSSLLLTPIAKIDTPLMLYAHTLKDRWEIFRNTSVKTNEIGLQFLSNKITYADFEAQCGKMFEECGELMYEIEVLVQKQLEIK